ncbi:MAG: hypothetical protein ABI670_18015 [Chloroflexota bacterium]
MAVTVQQRGSANANQLAPHLARYRALIRKDRRRRYLGVAAIAVSTIWLVVALLGYFDLAPALLTASAVALTVLIPAGALVYEVMQQPTIEQTASSLDKMLDNKQRMVTSVELMAAGEERPVAEAQLASSVGMLESINPRTLLPAHMPWPQLAISGGLLMFALGLFILKGGLGDNALITGNLPPSQDATSAVATATPQSNLPGSGQQPEQQQEQSSQMPGLPGQDGNNTTTQPLTPDEAAQQATQSREAQKSLQRLTRALDEQSVTQGAADALRQGDYAGASQQLAELGKQNDQLSDEAKRAIADSLDRAAEESAGTPDLQTAERNAADALRRGDYGNTSQGLEQLGKAIEDASRSVVPQQDMAKNFPDQQGQQQAQPGQQGQNGQQGQQDQSGQQGNQNGQQSGNQNGQQSQNGQQGQNGQNEQNGNGQQGQQGQDGQLGNQNGQNSGDPGALQGEGSRVKGPTARDLGVQGNPFEIDGNADPNANRPSDGSNPPGMTLDANPGGSGSATAPSSGGPITANGESNNTPVERWSIVQKYFNGK